jgi:hypothetical protein
MRWLRRGTNERAQITSDEAVARARLLCEREGLPWKEPVQVRKHRGCWVIWTNAQNIGGNIEIAVDAKTGATVRRWGPLSR